MRFTKTWSPISRVFSIELEGISNACTTKGMMNNPVTRPAASDDRNSTLLSRGFSSRSLFAFLSFFATVINPSQPAFEAILSAETLIHQPQRPVPPRDLEEMRGCVNKVRQFASYGTWCSDLAISFLYRPVNQQRPPNNIGLRHKPPIAAAVTIVPILPHHKIMSLGNNELSILYQFSKLHPPFRSLARRHIQPGKTIPERVIGGPAEVRIRLFHWHSVYEHLLVD